jgi:hypothetical protein
MGFCRSRPRVLEWASHGTQISKLDLMPLFSYPQRRVKRLSSCVQWSNSLTLVSFDLCCGLKCEVHHCGHLPPSCQFASGKMAKTESRYSILNICRSQASACSHIRVTSWRIWGSTSGHFFLFRFSRRSDLPFDEENRRPLNSLPRSFHFVMCIWEISIAKTYRNYCTASHQLTILSTPIQTIMFRSSKGDNLYVSLIKYQDLVVCQKPEN